MWKESEEECFEMIKELEHLIKDHELTDLGDYCYNNGFKPTDISFGSLDVLEDFYDIKSLRETHDITFICRKYFDKYSKDLNECYDATIIKMTDRQYNGSYIFFIEWNNPHGNGDIIKIDMTKE